MPIDSKDDVEVVETQIDAGLEKGDQVDCTIEDVAPNLTKEEMALSNMMNGDDGGWDDAEGGGEGSEGSSFGDALQGGEGTTDNGGNLEDDTSSGDSSDGGDTSTGGFKPAASDAAPEALRTMGRGSGGVKNDSDNYKSKDETNSNSHLDSLKEADYNKRLSDKNEWLFEGKENEKKMDEIKDELEKCNDKAVRVVLKNELAQRKAYQRIINDNIQNTHC